MEIEEIVEGAIYVRGDGRARRVVKLERDEVTFIVEGVFSLQPLRSGLHAFAEWAERRSPPRQTSESGYR